MNQQRFLRHDFTDRLLHQFAYRPKLYTAKIGFEPITLESESSVFPLHHLAIRGVGEIRTHAYIGHTVLQTGVLNQLDYYAYAAEGGIRTHGSF